MFFLTFLKCLNLEFIFLKRDYGTAWFGTISVLTMLCVSRPQSLCRGAAEDGLDDLDGPDGLNGPEGLESKNGSDQMTICV